MSTRKKVLSLGLLFLLASVGNIAKAYTIKLFNSTPYTAIFHIVLSGPMANPNPVTLAPFKTGTVYTGARLIYKVKAEVEESGESEAVTGFTQAIRRAQDIPAKEYKALGKHGLWGLARNQTFALIGPMGRGKNRKYVVTRLVR